MVQLALCLVNDSLRLTGLALTSTPAELAAAALHVSSLLLVCARELPFQGSSSWWDALGLDLTRLEALGAALLTLFREGQRVAE